MTNWTSARNVMCMIFAASRAVRTHVSDTHVIPGTVRHLMPGSLHVLECVEAIETNGVWVSSNQLVITKSF